MTTVVVGGWGIFVQDVPSGSEQIGWWERWWALGLLMAISAMPLIALPYAPFPDILGHMGRYAIQLNIDESETLGQFYAYDFALIGNIGIDLLVELFGDTVGIYAIVKWVAVAIPPLTIFGFAMIARQLTGRVPPTIGFAAILAFNFPYLFGFHNFALSAALALNAFALWIWMDRAGRRILRALVFLPLAVAIYLCHTFGWGILGLLVFGYEFATRREADGLSLQTIIRAGLNTFPLWLPLIQVVLWRTSMEDAETAIFFSVVSKLGGLASVLRDRSIIVDVLLLAPIVLLLVQAIRKDDFRFDTKLLWVFAPFALVFLIMPGTVFGSDYADTRMAPYGLALALLAVVTLKAPGVVAAIGFTLLGIRAITVGIGAHDGYRTIEANAEIFEGLPKGSRILQINGEVCPFWGHSRLNMISSFQIIRNEGFSNATWDMGGANPLSVTYDLPRYFRDDPVEAASSLGCKTPLVRRRLIELYQRYPSGKYDYVLLVQPPAWLDQYVEGEPIATTANTELYRAR